jgi:aldehyde:ferredoxin oxidoreductase
MINVREGFSRKDDEPPDAWFKPMKTYDGKEVFMTDYYKTKRLTREDVDQWLSDYYDERGWDIKKGIPTKEKLTELGLEELIPDLEKARL